jgi:DNA-binding transcriptional MerR regulator
MADRFTSRAGIALAGITVRLRSWGERGVVTPDPEGRRRLYTNQHLNQGAVVRQLRREGFSLPGVRNGMRFLDRKLDKCPAEIVDRSSPYHPLIARTHLYLESSAKPIMDIRKNSNQPILGLCRSDAVRRVRAGIASGKANTSVTSLDHRKRARKAS